MAYLLATTALFYVVSSNGLTLIQIFGMVLALIALIFWIIARIQLADNFSIGARANELVTTGLYAKLRHPVYYFSILALLGIIFAIGNYYLFIAVLALIALEASRIRAEERKLHDVFGKKYEEYKKSTWF